LKVLELSQNTKYITTGKCLRAAKYFLIQHLKAQTQKQWLNQDKK
jgi:hypothetical protein